MITFRTSTFPLFAAALLLLATLGRIVADPAPDTTYVRFNTTLGSIDVQLLDNPGTEAPLTVANFLGYVDSGAYYHTIFHRSVSNFIVQGGGYDLRDGQLTAIPAGPAVTNEFHVSNTRGTLAMAKLGSDPNSATNEWFFNEADNSSNLDNQNGGFTVFGKIANPASLAVMDSLAAVPIITAYSSPFDSLPAIDYSSSVGLQINNLVFITSIVRESVPTDATVILGDLAATSTGQAQGISVTTNPPGLATVITYSGGPGGSPLLISNQDAPSAVGSYTVTASITSPGYTGNATGTFVISAAATKTKATVKLGNLSAVYDGNAHAATATTNPVGLDVTYTYNGRSTVPKEAGSYAVVATINDATHQGSAKGTLVIKNATATVTIDSGSLSPLYDGTAKSATATTDPADLNVDFTYNGKATKPTAAGSYKVVGTVSDFNYTGKSSTETMVIGKATAPIVLGNLAAVCDGTPHAATATTTPPGLKVTFTYNGKTTVPSVVGSYNVIATINDPNYMGTQPGTLVISKGNAIVTLGNLAALANGKPHAITATTVPKGLKVTFDYNGSAVAPSAINNYPVTATVMDVNYNGSASGTLVISNFVAPLATTGSAVLVSNQGASEAALNGTVNPKGSDTVIHFEYGTTQAYGSTTSDQDIGSGTANVSVSANLASLSPQTLYHYRVVATSAAGVVGGADKTFTTLASPVIGASPATYLGAAGVEVGQSVNPSGIPTTVSFQYGIDTNYGNFTTSQIVNSKTVINVYALFENLLANQLYHYRMVTVSAAGTFYGSDATFTTLTFITAPVVLQGDADTGVSGALFATFGNPVINMNDHVAFWATMAGGSVTKTNNAGIWADDGTGTRQLIAQTGNSNLPAPDTNNATFLTLSDPVYNNHEAVAFHGVLQGAASSASNGIWSSSSGSLHLVARQGSSAPNASGVAIDGATFATFTNLALPDTGGVLFLATVNANKTAGIGTGNNTGIWVGNTAADLKLVVRTGDTINSKTLSKIDFLPTISYVNGQSRGFAPGTGDLVYVATFTDKSTSIIKIVAGAVLPITQSGTTATDAGSATWASFSSPTINGHGRTAFLATVAGGGIAKADDMAIWADDNTNAGNRQLVTYLGATAPGSGSATFATLNDPVYDDSEAVSFRALLKVVTGQATSSTAAGVWSSSSGSLGLVARQGSQAPGCPTGATFSGFTGLTLPDQGGTVLLATLNTNTAAGVTTANNTGIWAVDTSNHLQLIVRTGDGLNVNGTQKTVTALSFLPALSYVGGQARSFDLTTGDLVYLATFSDKTVGIFKVSFP